MWQEGHITCAVKAHKCKSFFQLISLEEFKLPRLMSSEQHPLDICITFS